MMDYFTRYVATRLWALVTRQSEPIPGSAQLPNSAGGFTWALDRWSRLDRFLVLGTEGGTYYVGWRPTGSPSRTRKTRGCWTWSGSTRRRPS